jgi:Brp/Blh family beta-carotene 15,15'-monooxygenase
MLVIPWASAILPALIYVSSVGIPQGWQYLPFAASLLLLGLPHGAADHLVPGRLIWGNATVGSMLRVALLYVVLTGIYLGLWSVAPSLAFLLFVLLTWFHWGQCDLYTLQDFHGADGMNGLSKALAIAVRGGLPMLVPLLAFPEIYRSIGEATAGVFGGGMPGWPFESEFRAAVALLLAMLAFSYFALRLRSGKPGALLPDVAEIVMLALYFSVVPPVLAIGLYFCLWHSLRHVGRLMLLNDAAANSLRRGRILPALGVFARDAAPLTMAALILLAGVYFAVPEDAGGPIGLLGVYLILLSVLTLPHTIIVTWMDRRQGV